MKLRVGRQKACRRAPQGAIASPWGEAGTKSAHRTDFVTDEGTALRHNKIFVLFRLFPSSGPLGHLPPRGKGLFLNFHQRIQQLLQILFAVKFQLEAAFALAVDDLDTTAQVLR